MIITAFIGYVLPWGHALDYSPKCLYLDWGKGSDLPLLAFCTNGSSKATTAFEKTTLNADVVVFACFAKQAKQKGKSTTIDPKTVAKLKQKYGSFLSRLSDQDLLALFEYEKKYPNLVNMSVGTLLGDASNELRGTTSASNSRLVLKQSGKKHADVGGKPGLPGHVDWLLYLYDFYKNLGFCQSDRPTVTKTNQTGKDGEKYTYIRCNTCHHPVFTILHRMFYSKLNDCPAHILPQLKAKKSAVYVKYVDIAIIHFLTAVAIAA